MWVVNADANYGVPTAGMIMIHFCTDTKSQRLNGPTECHSRHPTMWVGDMRAIKGIHKTQLNALRPRRDAIIGVRVTTVVL